MAATFAHAGITHLALAHWDAGTVPEALVCFCLFVIIVAAGTEWGAQLILCLCQTLQQRNGLFQI